MQRSMISSAAFLCLALILSSAGCQSQEDGSDGVATPAIEMSVPGGSWWGTVLSRANRTTGQALEVIHDGTGWILGKNKVDIEQVGDLQVVEGRRLAKFKITVSRSDESYSANIENIECDELGLPTEQSQEKMNEAVSKIKSMLDKLQS